jgi:hypothetical protein
MLALRCNVPLLRVPHTVAAAVDPLVGVTGAAAVGAVLRWTGWGWWLPGGPGGGAAVSQSGEVASELVCWAVLPVVCAVGARVVDGGSGGGSGGWRGLLPGFVAAGKGATSWSLWAVAAGLAAGCVYQAEVGGIWLFVSTVLGGQYIDLTDEC